MSQFVPLGVLLAACDEAEMHHGGELTALQLRLLCTLHANASQRDQLRGVGGRAIQATRGELLMLKDIFKALHAGLRAATSEWKRRRHMRRYQSSQPTPF